MTATIAAHAEAVRRYYDQNTAAFDRLGQGGASIHRAVWAPGVTSRAESFHHVDELILAALPEGEPEPRVVDLGCGLGASLMYLALRAPIRGEGLTISPRQAEGATRLLAGAALADRVRCREGNYLDVPADLHATADVVFSIEAFLHSPDAAGYFREAARVLRPGGRLLVCDDFLTPRAPDAPPREARRLAEFRDGWRVGSLLTVEQVRAAAAGHGLELVADVDLTPHLELRRPRDRFIAALVAAGRPLPLSGEYWMMLSGGDALQWCLLNGLLNYRVLTFELC
ncbi:methyltransferase domain-containing protein [Dactylosporangium sp. NPDC049140]|uniref:SAM-dependent methyltransferase n=1 Tax=Dactylosporangium sp. NPDC049140 TaxID=3155647 RepID=UPI0033E78EAD